MLSSGRRICKLLVGGAGPLMTFSKHTELLGGDSSYYDDTLSENIDYNESQALERGLS